MSQGDPDKTRPDPDQTIGPSDVDPDQTIGPESGQSVPDAASDPDATLPPLNTIQEMAGTRKPMTRGNDETVFGSSLDGGARLPVADRNINVPGYEIIDELGRGGMGVVYKARDVALNRIVALKMILAGVHASDDAIARFRIEAEAVAQLQHRGIVQVYDVGQADGQPYCALEFVDGGGLDELMAREKLSVSDAVAIVEELAHAMSSAHQAGIVHRDLKPANVLMANNTGSKSGSIVDATSLGNYRPKITDFGLAKRVEQDSQHTKTGAIMGTPGYMAPEQARGAKRIGPAADTYSLGAILFHLVTGKPPFESDTPIKTIMQVLNDKPASPRSINSIIDRDLDTIILKCLEKEPAARYASAEHLAQDLHRYQIGKPIEARPVSGVERMGKWIRRKPWSAAGIVAASLALLGVIIGGAVFNRKISAAYKEIDKQHEVAVNALTETSRALDAESRALGAESAALENTENALKRAEVSEAESRRRLVDNYVNNGLQSMVDNQMLAALPWLSEAIVMETDPERLQTHQLRFNMALRNAPKPVRTWLTDAAILECSFSEDGKQLSSRSSDLSVRIYDIESNKVVRETKAGSQIVSYDIASDHSRAIIGSVSIDPQAGFSVSNVLFHSWDIQDNSLGDGYSLSIEMDPNKIPEPAVNAVRNWLFLQNPENEKLEIVDLGTHQVVKSFDAISSDIKVQISKSGEFVIWQDGTKIRVRQSDDLDNDVLQIDLTSEKAKDANFRVLDSTTLAVADENLKIYDLNTAEVTMDYPQFGTEPPMVAYSRQSKVAVFVWDQGRVHMVDSDGRSIDKKTVSGVLKDVYFSPDGNQVYLASLVDVTAFDARTGIKLGSPIPSTLRPLQNSAISPDGNVLAVCSGAGLFHGNGCLRIWRRDNRQNNVILNPAEPDNRIGLMTPHPNGNLIAVHSERNGALEIHDVRNRANPKKLVSLLGKTSDLGSRRVRNVDWSPQADRIAVCLDDQVRVFAIPSGNEICRFEIENPNGIQFDNQGKKLAVSYGDDGKLIAIVDAISGQLLVEEMKHKRFVRAMSFLGENKLGTISDDFNYRLFDVSTGEQIEKENVRMIVKSAAFSNQGDRVAVCGERFGEMPGQLVLLDVENGKPLFQGINLEAVATKVRFSETGKLVALADINGLVKIFHSDDGTDQGIQLPHPTTVTDIRFSHDDRVMLTVCEDGKLRLFDVTSGLLVAAPMEGTNIDDSRVLAASFLGKSYDICKQSKRVEIISLLDRKFSPEHASSLSRFLSGALISNRGTIVHAPAKSLMNDFSNVTIHEMMDSNLLRHIIRH